MLKIKQDKWREFINRCEEFGFEYENEEECVGSFEDDDYDEYFYEWFEWHDFEDELQLKVKSDREIVLVRPSNYYSFEVLDCIYDLIQAGLVEKID